MTIYGEYLFFENFITGLVILYFTGKIAGEKIKRLRLLLCGICCGLYAFTMFAVMSPPAAICLKTVFVVGVSALAYGCRSVKRTLLNGVMFMAVTFLYGGVTIALLSCFQWEGLSSAEGVYMPAPTYAAVLSAAAAAMLAVWLIISLVRAKRSEVRTRVSVTLRMGAESWDMEGLIDSGNFLREPFTGKPVAVVRRSVMERILKNYGGGMVRYMAIPYSSVGVEKGVMDGYRIDALTVNGQTVTGPVLAVCRDEAFLAGGNEKGQILLPESMLERGIYGNLNDDQGIFSETLESLREKYFLHRRQRRAACAADTGRGAEDA